MKTQARTTALRTRPSAMPRPEERDLIAGARRVLAPASTLLSTAGSPMLTLATTLGRDRSSAIYFWSGEFELSLAPGYLKASETLLARAALQLRRAGADVADRLSRRWPANAVPEVIGMVTDGVGLAVSGAHPSALTPAWFTDHVIGRAPVSLILPFGTVGQHALHMLSTPERH